MDFSTVYFYRYYCKVFVSKVNSCLKRKCACRVALPIHTTDPADCLKPKPSVKMHQIGGHWTVMSHKMRGSFDKRLLETIGAVRWNSGAIKAVGLSWMDCVETFRSHNGISNFAVLFYFMRTVSCSRFYVLTVAATMTLVLCWQIIQSWIKIPKMWNIKKNLIPLFLHIYFILFWKTGKKK